MTDAEYEAEWQKNNPEDITTENFNEEEQFHYLDPEVEALFHYPPGHDTGYLSDQNLSPSHEPIGKKH
ncbi:hypothetical protein A2U01_0078919 [Trifolium medium]|uniref:Uncharacterized protein n=1 Tax=Trifolium medium TaxID=97028 RepID=A0A392T9G7_9FABA|nr:hypothetical protein [Trifolium medium]